MSDEPVDIAQPVQPVTCRCCGAVHAADHIEVTDLAKTEWLRHILGAKHFSQSYELYGGTVVFTFEKPTIEQARVAEKALAGDTADIFEDRAIEKLGNVALVTTLVSFARGAEIPYTFDPELTWEARLAKLIETLGDQLLGEARSLSRRFNLTIQALTERASDPDFWKAAVSAI